MCVLGVGFCSQECGVKGAIMGTVPGRLGCLPCCHTHSGLPPWREGACQLCLSQGAAKATDSTRPTFEKLGAFSHYTLQFCLRAWSRSWPFAQSSRYPHSSVLSSILGSPHTQGGRQQVDTGSLGPCCPVGALDAVLSSWLQCGPSQALGSMTAGPWLWG